MIRVTDIQSAVALRDDLQAFLEDRPIAARPVGAVERLWRWARRNRALAAAGATALLLLVATAAVSTFAYVHTSLAGRQVSAALASEQQERRRAEAAAQLAVGALDDIFQRFAPDAPSDGGALTTVTGAGDEIQVGAAPVLSKETAALLEHLLAYYDRLAAEEGGDSGLRDKVALANSRIGGIHQRLGNAAAAKAAYERAQALYQQLRAAAAPPEAAAWTLEIARLHNQLGRLQHAAGDAERTDHRRALAVLQAMEGTSALEPQFSYELARTHYSLGRTRRHVPHSPPRGGRDGSPGPDFFPDRDHPRPPPSWLRDVALELGVPLEDLTFDSPGDDRPDERRPPGPRGEHGRRGAGAATAAVMAPMIDMTTATTADATSTTTGVSRSTVRRANFPVRRRSSPTAAPNHTPAMRRSFMKRCDC